MSATAAAARGAPRGIATNAALNVLGQAAPLAVAFFTIPLLTRALGLPRFGVLTLAWAVLGYFSLFDLGLGRALTKLVADADAAGRESEVPSLVSTGVATMFALGLAGAAVVGALTPWLVRSALDVPAELRPETTVAFALLAASLPLVVAASGLRGVLEARLRFDLVNAVRLPLGVLTFLGPALVLPFSRSLAPITAVLLAGRAVALWAYWRLARRAVPGLGGARAIRYSHLPVLLGFGGWMTVSNVVSPLMVSSDRFLLAALLGLADVAYYTAPYEAITRLWIIPGALASVLFPALSAAYALDPLRARSLYARGVKATFLIVAPVAVAAGAFAPELLHAWLGPEFAARGATALRWLAAGVLVNSVAHVPFALVQGAGRPDITAKLHLVELPLYLAASWWLIATFGIAGAAAAFALRASVDAVALFHQAGRILDARWRGAASASAWLAVAGAVAVALAVAPFAAPARVAVAALLALVTVRVVWRFALTAEDRARVEAHVPRLARRVPEPAEVPSSELGPRTP